MKEPWCFGQSLVMPHDAVAQSATGFLIWHLLFDMLALITSSLLILSASSLAADAIFMTGPALQNKTLLLKLVRLSTFFQISELPLGILSWSALV